MNRSYSSFFLALLFATQVAAQTKATLPQRRHDGAKSPSGQPQKMEGASEAEAKDAAPLSSAQPSPLGGGQVVPPIARTEREEQPSVAVRASRAEAAGDLHGAARILEPAVRAARKNHALPLQLAWVDFRLQRYTDAEVAYRLTIDRGGASPEAHAGLAWSLVRQGRERCEEAREFFRRALAARPTDNSAREGLALCNEAPLHRPFVWMTVNGYLFADHPWKAHASGAAIGVSFPPTEHVTISAAYRFVRLRALPEIPLDPFTQHETYLLAGYATEKFGVELHGALVFGDTGPAGTSPHVGALFRWSPYGDVTLDMAQSFYDDTNVFRASPSWRIPLGQSFHVVPGAAVQRFAARIAGTGMLTLLFDGVAWSAWFGGKYGDEYRPAYLSSFVIYDIAEYNTWGLWGGARIRLSQHLDASATYSFDRMKDAATGVKSAMHYLSIGPAVTF